MAIRTAFPTFGHSLQWIANGLASFRKPVEQADMTPDDVRARRDYINRIITDEPGAFSGEQDVQNMMHMFPGRF